MIRKLLAVAGAAVLLLLVVPAAPASALSTSNFACKSKSGIGYDIRACAQFGWRVQNDGTGVHFENARIFLSRGCGDVESQAISGLLITADGSGGRAVGAQYGCDVTWDIEANGPDNGMGTIQAHYNVNVNNAPDFDVNLYCEVHPNTGNSNCWPFEP